VWVLTGDKQETAINIAFSSRLVDEVSHVALLSIQNELKYRTREN
jgi:magnesium-transporting ATPase (P-type)